MGTASLKSRSPGARTLFLRVFLGALIVSVLLHVALLRKASSWGIKGFSPESYDTIVPRTFRMKRVEIDPKTLEEPKAPEKKQETTPSGNVIPLEKEHPLEGMRPSSEAEKPLLPTPKEWSSSGLPQEQPAAAAVGGLDQLLSQAPVTPLPKAMLEVAPGEAAVAGTTGAFVEEMGRVGRSSPATPAFSSLDDLLQGTGTVSAATAPILMPTDLLFEYDAASLRPEAERTLEKLGSLIQRNGGANFRIEGHTDAFGSEEYNQPLSLRRANAVKDWLVARMGVEPARITTVGFGKSRLLVPPTRSVEQQQLNRRVEIVITTPTP